MRTQVAIVLVGAILGVLIVVVHQGIVGERDASDHAPEQERAESRPSQIRETSLAGKSQREPAKISAEELVERAEFFYRSNDHEAAVDVISIALEREPADHVSRRLQLLMLNLQNSGVALDQLRVEHPRYFPAFLQLSDEGRPSSRSTKE